MQIGLDSLERVAMVGSCCSSGNSNSNTATNRLAGLLATEREKLE